ncbi:hypothetical protein ACIP79_19125 [Streptomyces sp. NPDC088747]|uniref:hypothetical protein n=1 Tax=Streptomyces sp. NPDC088747 TaxID=3365886 RepID=UPI003801A09E
MSAATPDQEESPQRGSGEDRRWNWTTIGNFIAAAGVVGGLVFAGAGVWMQAEQAKEQTKTLKDEDDRAAKQQAVQVAIQPLTTFDDGRRTAVVTNRSSSPIYQLRVYTALSRSSSDTEHGDIAFVTLGSLSPCTNVRVDLNAVANDLPVTRKALLDHRPLDYGVTFTDSLGKGFHRHAAGMFNPSAWLEYVDNGVGTPALPNAFQHFDRHTDTSRSGVIGAMTAGVKSDQYGVVGTPSEADLCVNSQ